MWQNARNRMYICSLRCHIFFLKVELSKLFKSTVPLSQGDERIERSESSGGGIAVLLGKVAHRLVRAHHRHQLLEGDGSRLRIVHTAEKA